MTGGLRLLAAALLLCCGLVSGVRADQSIVHVVRPGETLASIADRYYGDPRRESVLVAENGLTSEGGSAIVVGLRLSVPTVSFHRVQEGETWAQLAKRFFGDARRAFVLIEANDGSSGAQPDPGAELLVPYPLRHVVGQHESLRQIAKGYFDKVSKMTLLKRFNNMRTARLQRGQIVLIPLDNLMLSEQGRQIAEDQGVQQVGKGDVREKQARINERLPGLIEQVRSGAYADAVASANRLIGAGDLTGNQVVTVERELGTALVALGRNDLAEQAFVAALKQQPDLELDVTRTSPKVMAVFEQAKVATEPKPAQEKVAAKKKPGPAKKKAGKKKAGTKKKWKAKAKTKARAKTKAKAKSK